jgi:hypothetical protein
MHKLQGSRSSDSTVFVRQSLSDRFWYDSNRDNARVIGAMVRKGGFENSRKRTFNDLQGTWTLCLVAKTL